MARIRCSCLLAVALLAMPASADPLAIETHGELPFTVAELESALAVRAVLASPDNARSITAAVTNEGAVIRVAVAGHDRSLTLEGQHGVDAARLVAFAILDLAGDQLDPPDAPARTLAPPMPRVDPPAIHHAAAPAIDAPPIDNEPRMALGVWGRGGSRVEGELELAVAIAGPVRAIVSGGAGTRTTSQAAATIGTVAVALRAYPVRAGLAWRGPAVWLGQLEARATAIALVETASSVVTRTDAIYGGGLAIGWAAPLVALDGRRGATLTVGIGVDGFATANDYRVSAMPVTTTQRVAWWGGVGIAAELWR